MRIGDAAGICVPNIMLISIDNLKALFVITDRKKSKEWLVDLMEMTKTGQKPL
ncbi:hypothetical protein D3C77_458910 [compost metagenome]